MRNPLIWMLMLATVACTQPTREELLEAQLKRDEQCREMLEELDASKDRPLIRASLQENYNRTCLGSGDPDEQQ